MLDVLTQDISNVASHLDFRLLNTDMIRSTSEVIKIRSEIDNPTIAVILKLSKMPSELELLAFESGLDFTDGTEELCSKLLVEMGLSASAEFKMLSLFPWAASD